MLNNPESDPLLIIVSAPSGAGKTTLCQGLLDSDSKVRRVTTCTTRPPRVGEQDGVDYHFLPCKAFKVAINQGQFLEFAEVYGNLYGTRKEDVLREMKGKKDVLLNIDVQGAHSIRKMVMEDATIAKALVTVFLSPPSLVELEDRLRNRAQDKEEIILQRLKHAKTELREWQNFDYLIVSGTREQDLQNLLSIVEAERLKSKRRLFDLS
jgi:guanylate kinase